MNKLLQEAIKNLTKSELKIEFSKRDLSLSGKKGKKPMEILNEEINKLYRPEKSLEKVSIDMIKEHFTELFKAQEETIIKIVSCCNTDTIARLNRLTEEIQDNNERLNKLNKETNDLKLSLSASQ